MASSNRVEYGALLNTSNDASRNNKGGTHEGGVLPTTSDTTLSTTDETEAAHTILDDDRARYSLRCVFEQDAWYDEGEATIGNEILNLVKNIVGSGGLSLPAGIATFGNAPSAIIPSILIIFIMGVVNAYSFSLLGRVCSVTKSKTYQDAWDRSMGRRHGTKYNLWVGLVVTGKAILGCWSFSIVIASTCQPLLQNLIPAVTKSETLIGITIFVLLPLCLAENLRSLAGFSVVGQIGTLVTAFTMALRYFDGSYREGGNFYDDAVASNLQPSFGDKGWLSFFTPQSLILISILSQGYVAHYNAPKYYYELKDHTTGRFNVVVNISFFCAGLTYMLISSLGFLTFGENSSGFILDNYSYRDNFASASRLGVALSVIFAYPLLFLGGRDGWIALLGITGADSRTRRSTTLLLLTVVTVLAIFMSDLTFVLSFSGATLSAAIIYIFPPLMFQALVLNCTCVRTFVSNWEIKESQAMLWLGVILGVCGAVVTIVRTFF